MVRHAVETFARTLRKKQTDAERRLWAQLRSGRLLDFKFRRQHPVGPYFEDFCCLENKLIVELDGGQHAERQNEDSVRTAYLVKLGFKVIRFWDNEVFSNLEGVMETIRGCLLKSPSPGPSPSREREKTARIKGNP